MLFMHEVYKRTIVSSSMKLFLPASHWLDQWVAKWTLGFKTQFVDHHIAPVDINDYRNYFASICVRSFIREVHAHMPTAVVAGGFAAAVYLAQNGFAATQPHDLDIFVVPRTDLEHVRRIYRKEVPMRLGLGTTPKTYLWKNRDGIQIGPVQVISPRFDSEDENTSGIVQGQTCRPRTEEEMESLRNATAAWLSQCERDFATYPAKFEDEQVKNSHMAELQRVLDNLPTDCYEQGYEVTRTCRVVAVRQGFPERIDEGQYPRCAGEDPDP